MLKAVIEMCRFYHSVVQFRAGNQQSFPTILIGGHCAGNIMALSGKLREEIIKKDVGVERVGMKEREERRQTKEVTRSGERKRKG